MSLNQAMTEEKDAEREAKAVLGSGRLPQVSVQATTQDLQLLLPIMIYHTIKQKGI